MNLDIFIFQQINGLADRWPYLDALGVFFAEYLQYVLVVVIFWIFRKNIRMIFLAFAAAVLAKWGIAELIRLIWFRPRPFIENSVNLLIDKVNESSFPSGHAAFFFAISTVILLYCKKVYPASKFWCGAGIVFFFASFLVSIARVFVGVHWPSDILAGAFVGIFSGWLVMKISRRF